MPPTRIEDVLRFLGVDDPGWLYSLRKEGLFEQDLLDEVAAEELRIAHSLTRELGVNPAGVEVILHMRRRMLCLQGRMERSLRQLIEELDSP
jgi:hypothetical protein